MTLSVDMVHHLLKPYRHLAWLARFERPTGPDLYVWTGAHHHTYGGNLYYGYGYLASIESMRKGEGTQQIEQVFELNGLDPSILADLDESVRSLEAEIWLAGVGPDRQFINTPLKVSSLVQDTLAWRYAMDGNTVTLRLTTYDALPFLGRVNGGKWSYEDQVARYPGDTGFTYNTAISLAGPAVQWTAP